MKAWILENKLTLDHLALVERPTPSPIAGEVLVRIRAMSVNPHDVMAIQGHYGPLPLPLIPLGDGAGEVVAVGPGVTRVAIGDRVAGVFLQRWIAGRPPADARSSMLGTARAGVLAEYAIFDAEGTVQVPHHLSFEEAATLPIAGVTAWHALFGGVPVGPGDTALVQGTGGVGMFAIQLARAAGATVIAISSSDAKLARAREHGATEVINYVTTPRWEVRARELTHGVGVDLVVDVAGGSLQRSVDALRFGGQVSLVGMLGDGKAEVSVGSVLMNRVRLQGISTGSREQFEELNRALSRHRIHPVIDRTYAFEDAPRALAALANREPYVGKLVIRGAADV
jgi:NADPH:quinone reductase-like Zn-dependent oxidoreductase